MLRKPWCVIRAARHWLAMLILSGTGVSGLFAAPSKRAVSMWDATLPNIELTQVNIQARSLYDARQILARRYAVRFVICVSNESGDNAKIPFEFRRDKCTVRELLDALIKTYSEFTWTQDDKTGVIWIYPKSWGYTDILPQRLAVSEDQFGLRMYTDILEGMEKTHSPPYLFTSITVSRDAFLQTFDYGVDIPRGNYTVRDVLNLCCVANPAVEFTVGGQRGGAMRVLPARFLSVPASSLPPAGALQFWNVEIGRSKDKVPSNDELISALANSNPDTRREALRYMEVAYAHIPQEELIREAPSDKALWVCFGIADLSVRTEDGTEPDVISRLKKECSDEFFRSGDPQLATLAAFWMARLGQGTHGLEIVSQRNFSEQDLAPIKSQLHRLLRGPNASVQRWVQNQPRNTQAEIENAERVRKAYSNPLHDAVSNLSLNWPGFSKTDIEHLASNPNPFQAVEQPPQVPQ